MQRLHPAIARRRILSLIICGTLISCFAQVARTQQFDTPIYTSGPAANSAQTTGPSPFERPLNVATNTGNTFDAGPALSPPSQFDNATGPLSVDVTVGSQGADNLSTEADTATSTDVGGGDTTGTTTEDNENAALNEFLSTFSDAIHGDRKAQISLANDYLLPLFGVFVVMFIANWIGNYVRSMVTRFVSKQVDATLGQFTGNLTKYAIMAIAIVVVLGKFGIGTAGLAAVVAALGFAVGMALQGTLSNFASGIALLVFRPFSVGDYIVVADEEGTVREISLFTTAIDTLDNRHIIIPNDSVFGNKIQNWSHNADRRVDVLVGVSYDADTATTRQVLLNAMANIQGADQQRGPQIYLCELNSSSVDWSCRVWCRPEDYLDVKERVTEAAKLALDQNGIGIPYPQLDLHVVAAAAQQRMAA